MRVHQVMSLQTGDCKHGRAVELCVVQAVQQVNTAWTGGRQATSELTRVLGVSACHQRRSLFMPHVNKADLILTLAERLHDPVDSIARQTEDYIHAPIVNGIDENVGSSSRH